MQSLTQSWQFPLELPAGTAGRPMASTDDRSLRGRLARGDEQAFNLVYERYQGPIYRFAWHMGGDRAMAEEITQDVFMILIRKPRGYDPDKGSLGGYLFGIARNLTRRSREKLRGHIPFVDEAAESDQSYAIDERAS